jgi:uncharacterized protein YdhG (YjbR/CyaY superfamily)
MPLTAKLQSTLLSAAKLYNERNCEYPGGMMDKPSTIDEYIQSQRPAVRERLALIRSIFTEALPEATEKIAWGMPTFWQGRNIIHFAAFSHHIGIYPGSQAVTEFSQRLDNFNTSKGSIRIPDGSELPRELLSDIARWCLHASQRP